MHFKFEMLQRRLNEVLVAHWDAAAADDKVHSIEYIRQGECYGHQAGTEAKW